MEIDLAEFGFTPPPEVPANASGDAAFDKAVEMVRKRAASMAKKGEWGLVKLPARFNKLTADDEARLLALLPEAAFESGEAAFDLSNHSKEYLAAWRQLVSRVEPHQGLVTALVHLALTYEGAEEVLRPRLKLAMGQPSFATKLNAVLRQPPRPLAAQTLAVGVEAIETDGVERDLYNCWRSAAELAAGTDAQLVVDRILPKLETDRSKAVLDALEGRVDGAWRPTLIEQTSRGVERAGALLLRLEPDSESVAAVAKWVAGQPAWGPKPVDYLIAHADEAAIGELPDALAEHIRSRRS